MYPKIGSKEASTLGKRKKTPKALQAPLADSSRPITINVSDDDEYVDPVASQLPFASQTAYGSCSLAPLSEDHHGSSDSSMPDQAPTPRHHKKKRKEDAGVDLAAAMFDKLSERMI